jgi:hypothetical protein
MIPLSTSVFGVQMGPDIVPSSAWRTMIEYAVGPPNLIHGTVPSGFFSAAPIQVGAVSGVVVWNTARAMRRSVGSCMTKSRNAAQYW